MSPRIIVTILAIVFLVISKFVDIPFWVVAIIYSVLFFVVVIDYYWLNGKLSGRSFKDGK